LRKQVLSRRPLVKQVRVRDREATARVWGWLNSCSPPHSRADSAGIALEALAMRTPSGSCTGLTPPEPVPTVSSATQRTSDSPRALQPATSGQDPLQLSASGLAEGLQPVASGHEGPQAAGPAPEGLQPAASGQECCSAGALRGARLSAPLDDGGSTSGRAARRPQSGRLEEAVSVSGRAPPSGELEAGRGRAAEQVHVQSGPRLDEVGRIGAEGQACDAGPLAGGGAVDGVATGAGRPHAEPARPGLLRRGAAEAALEREADPVQPGAGAAL
jgi:hypothetical protein